MDTMKTNTSPELSLRERYFNKEIFNVGDLVESNQVEFKIISRGTNYLFLEDVYGNRTKKWIQDVIPMKQNSYTFKNPHGIAEDESKECKDCEETPCSCIDDSDESIDKMIKHIDHFDDIVDLYDDDELHIVDEDGNHHSHLSEDIITEVLTRLERIKARVRFAQTAGKRERKLQIALHTRSTPTKINHRARILAVKILKLKLAKKPLSDLSFQEKERLERIIAKKKVLLSRMALKLSPRIRAIENTRLHSAHTGK